MARNRKRSKQRRAYGRVQATGSARSSATQPAAAVEPDVPELEPDTPVLEPETAESLSEAVADDTGDEAELPVAAAPRAAAPREGSRVAAFLSASWAELQRVQWPDRRQVAQATAVVLGFVVIAGSFLGLADYVTQKIVDAIL